MVSLSNHEGGLSILHPLLFYFRSPHMGEQNRIIDAGIG
jgi:hypothetical protein